MLTVFATEASDIYGHGHRFVIWFSGCSLHCKGCMNQNMWEKDSGTEVDVESLVKSIIEKQVDGVTYIGGEPLEQDEDILVLSDRIIDHGMDIVLFTGYEFEELSEFQRKLWDKAVVIISGRFDISKRDTYLAHRGSSNQKIIVKDDCLKEYYSEEVRQVEIIIDEDSETYLGFPEDFVNENHHLTRGKNMEKKRIIERMKQLAELIHYEPGDITHLANAMCVNVLENGNTSNKEYSNGSLATLGDTVLKLILTEKLYLEGKDRGDITIRKSDIESNKSLHMKTLSFNIQSFAYNDQFFFDEAPKHLQLPNPAHDIYIEAIVGAIYLDRGLKYCKNWIDSNDLISI